MKENQLKQLIKEEIRNVLNESKQVGTLYHFTDEESLLGILKDNKMIGYKRSTEKSLDKAYYISFTRNKNLFLNPSRIRSSFQVGIVFDGDKLSNKYKFEPHNSTESKKNEYEERIKIPPTLDRNIPNIKEYITKIIILGDKFFYKEHVSNLQDEIKKYINVPIEVIYKSKSPIKITKDIKQQQDALKQKFEKK